MTTEQWRYSKLEWPRLCRHHKVSIQATLMWLGKHFRWG